MKLARWIFFDESHRRVTESEQFLRRSFAAIYDGDERDPERDLRAVESVRGEFIREFDQSIVLMADGDPTLTKALAWMSIYDYNFRILALKTRADQQKQIGQSFGRSESWP